MSEHDYDQLSMWQDILDDVVNGRMEGHTCPFCNKQTIEAEGDEAGVYVKCTNCGRWVEGAMPF